MPERVAFQRRKRGNQKVYKDPRWKAVRQLALARDEYVCRECLKKGLVTPATVVDHVLPINLGGAEFALNNTQSLCDTCHNSKSGGEGHKKKENGDKV
jgi:5-methylcytosine-specific restriction protein A